LVIGNDLFHSKVQESISNVFDSSWFMLRMLFDSLIFCTIISGMDIVASY